MASPSKWKLWLLAFLLLEIPAAADGKKGGTLSEMVWDYFDRPWKRAALLVFLATLTSHLVVGTPSGLWIILTGIPVGLLFVIKWDKPE